MGHTSGVYAEVQLSEDIHNSINTHRYIVKLTQWPSYQPPTISFILKILVESTVRTELET